MDIQVETGSREGALGRRWQPMPLEDLIRIEGLGLHWPALGRLPWALWLNVLAPGTGLIALQRESAGLPLAVSFLVLAEAALLGLLVVPGAMGATLTAAVVALAGTVWLAAQVLFLRRARQLQDLERQILAAARIEQAREAVLAGEWGSAKQMLEEIAEYDIEQPERNWLLAKVYSAVARSDQAARQWRRVREVDSRGRYERDIEQALQPGPVGGRGR